MYEGNAVASRDPRVVQFAQRLDSILNIIRDHNNRLMQAGDLLSGTTPQPVGPGNIDKVPNPMGAMDKLDQLMNRIMDELKVQDQLSNRLISSL